MNKSYAGFTFGYNRPLLAERIHDILTAIAFAKNQFHTKRIHLVGFGKAGPWVVLARALSGDSISRTAADMNNFHFHDVTSFDDEMMLPGTLKYGGMPVLSSLCAPHELLLHNCKGVGPAQWLESSYQAVGRPGNLRHVEERITPEEVIAWVLRD